MANERRVYANFLSGTLNVEHTATVTTLDALGLTALPVIDATNQMTLVLDPLSANGASEAVVVSAHAAGAATATVVRGLHGTTARIHPAGTRWIHTPLAFDVAHPQRIRGYDTRNINESPTDLSWFKEHSVLNAPLFKTGGAIGLPGGHYSVQTIQMWADDSGGGFHQLAFGNGGTGDLWHRYGTRGGGWGPWKSISAGDHSWHYVGTAGEPAFENGWINYDNDTRYLNARFRKDGDGYVHMQGLVEAGAANTVVFTLPAGYRPANPEVAPLTYAAMHFALGVSGSPGVAQGYVRFDGGVAAPVTAWTDLSGVPPFLAEV